MKAARMAIEQFRMQNTPNYAIIKITNAEGEVAEKCKELGYEQIMLNEFWARVYNNEDFAKFRNPFVEMIKNGMITK